MFDAQAEIANLAAEGGYLPFPFKDGKGVQRQLTNAMLLPSYLTDKLARAYVELSGRDAADITADDLGDLVDLISAVIESADDEETADALRALPQAVLMQLFAAWTEWGQSDDQVVADAGKELGPSSGRNRQERRSKPTARSGRSTSTGSRGTKQ